MRRESGSPSDTLPAAPPGVAIAPRLVRACFAADVMALKPGNVSRYAAGHGMRAEDFLRSGTVVSPILCERARSVGERILRAVQATMRQVGCNTNLGMLLLFAPLIRAAEEAPAGGLAGLRQALAKVLADLRGAEGERIFRAIREARPGGLGSSRRYDVRSASGHELLEAMRHARRRDRIALQYVSGYEDIFSSGIPCFSKALARYGDVEWALTMCYIEFLCSFADSHVCRRHGRAAAEALCGKALRMRQALLAREDPRDCLPALLQLDGELKGARINPGTSADLAAASLLAWRLVHGDGALPQDTGNDNCHGGK